MDDLDLLKDLPGRVDPPDEASKERMRALMEARSAPRSFPRRRHVAKVGLLGIAAVLAVASLAGAIAVHPWTGDDAVGFEGIPNPDGAISSTADFEAAVAEFAPAIRLPEGGSFDPWVRYWVSLPEGMAWPASNMIGSGLTRGSVADQLVRVAQCQWGQQWLDASAAGDRAGTVQATRVMEDIDGWSRSHGLTVGKGASSYLLDGMRNDDRVEVQLLETDCAYTGSWGTTPSAQDATTTGRLTSAAEIVQRYLRDGGDPAGLGPRAAQNLARDINWTDSHTQPAPAGPGLVFIGSSAGAGVTLVATSESGTQFCAVVTDAEVQRGTTINDLSTVNADGTAVNAQSLGPVICTPGGW